MSKSFNIKEIKYLFQQKIKDRYKKKGISFSYEEKGFPKSFKNRKRDISIKQKIIDKAIINSFKKYSSLKRLIYAKEKNEKINVKIDKMEKENLQDLKNNLNYTKLLQLFNIAFNKYNPFNYNIQKKKKEVQKANKSIYQKKMEALVKKIFHDKIITSKIDSGIKKDSDFNNIYQKIDNSIFYLEKLKTLKEKKLLLHCNTTREFNNSNINLFKGLSKSNSYVRNKSTFLKYNNYFYNLNNSSSINEKLNKNESLNFEPLDNNTLKGSDNVNNDINKNIIKILNKCQSESKINKISSGKKYNNFSIINNFIKRNNKSDNNITNKIKLKLKYDKNINSYKNRNFINSNIIKTSKDNNNNYSSNIKISKNKKNIDEGLKKYNENVKQIFREYNKIKTNSNQLKIDYKLWHFSKFSNIEEIVNVKEDMLLDLLKQKYFRNQSHYPKSKKIKKKQNKSMIEIIKEDFNRIEDEEFKFSKKAY